MKLFITLVLIYLTFNNIASAKEIELNGAFPPGVKVYLTEEQDSGNVKYSSVITVVDGKKKVTPIGEMSEFYHKKTLVEFPDINFDNISEIQILVNAAREDRARYFVYDNTKKQFVMLTGELKDESGKRKDEVEDFPVFSIDSENKVVHSTYIRTAGEAPRKIQYKIEGDRAIQLNEEEK